MASKDAFWRGKPASSKQLGLIRDKAPELYSPTLTKGQASDILSKLFASSGRNAPATAKQKRLLMNLGYPGDIEHITVGQASKFISENLPKRA